MSRGELDQLGDTLLGVQAAELGLRIEDRERRPIVRGIEGASVQGLPLNEVPGDHAAAVAVETFDEQFIGPADVRSKLAVMDSPLFFGSIMHNIMELGSVDSQT